MSRCATARLAVLAAGLLLLLPASAQDLVKRSFPAHALRGELVVLAPPEASLDRQPARLAPGARIRGANNLIVQSAGLSGQPLLVHYTRDGRGELREIWILRADEAANPWPRNAEEASRLVFDPVAQTWSRP
jgi:hypothetical protein